MTQFIERLAVLFLGASLVVSLVSCEGSGNGD